MTTVDLQGFINLAIEHLKLLESGHIRVLDATLELVDDLTDTPAWRVTLHLPSPRSETWNSDDLETVMREARRSTDRDAVAAGVAAPGTTSVSVIAVDPPDDSVALPSEPEPGENGEPSDDTGSDS